MKEILSSAEIGEAIQQTVYYSRSSVYNWPEDRKHDKKKTHLDKSVFWLTWKPVRRLF